MTTRWPSAVLSTSRVGGVLDRQSGDHAAVGERHDERAKAIADRRARAQDRADQLVLAVLDADRREVGADPLAAALRRGGSSHTRSSGPEEDLAAPVGIAVAAEQLADRRQRPAGGRLGQRQNAAASLRTLAVADGVQAAWSPRSSGRRAACRLGPASSTRDRRPAVWTRSLQRLAAQAQWVVVARSELGQPIARSRAIVRIARTAASATGSSSACLAPMRSTGRRVGWARSERARAPRRRRPAPPRRRLASPARASSVAAIARVCGRGGQLDPLQPRLGIGQRLLDELRDARVVRAQRFQSAASRRASIAQTARRCWTGSSVCQRHLGHQRRRSRARSSARGRRRRPAAARAHAGAERLASSSGTTSRR